MISVGGGGGCGVPERLSESLQVLLPFLNYSEYEGVQYSWDDNRHEVEQDEAHVEHD